MKYVKAFYVLHISTYVNDMLLLFLFKQQQSIDFSKKKKNNNQLFSRKKHQSILIPLGVDTYKLCA